jgi:predicted alpha-1,2-mannosidase
VLGYFHGLKKLPDQLRIIVLMISFKKLYFGSLYFLLQLPSLLIAQSNSQQLTRYVDPLIGSGGHGHVFVGASVPFGAVQVGPSNIYKGWDWCSGYNYGDSIIIGFSQLHLSGTGIGDLNDVLIMPFTGKVRLDKGTEQNHKAGYSSIYSHKNETSKAGYYAVKLEDSNVKIELTASERVGFHQYHFPENTKDAHIIIDLKEGINDRSTETYLELTDPYTIKGYRFSSGWAKNQQVYFAIKSSKPLDQFVIYDNEKSLEGKSNKGKALKGMISFADSPGMVQLKVGISPISPENALANIEAEIPHWDFQKIVKLADKKWNKELEKIMVKTKSEKDKRIFYTSLFHTMINPSLYSDHNGAYRGTDKNVHQKPTFNNYSVFSLWDTYRAANPLYAITQPERVDDMINSMLAIYKQQGKLPIWHLMGNETGTMVGISSMQVVAEAYLKGYKGFDANLAWEAIKATADSDSLGMMYVKNFKPIPSDKIKRSVASALEYAISDASIALMAQKMGKTKDYEYFKKRSENYKLYFDKKTEFFRGKQSDGSWNPVFDPIKSYHPYADDFAEGNSWQYLWLVPQDVKGLQTLLGGEKPFIEKLDSLFSLKPENDPNALVDLTGLIGQYAHGNEPSHHITYLYNYVGQPWKTAEKVRHIVKEMYDDKPDGIIGNEDCGQMSAWYIFSSLGFYPVFPASGNYVIGSPIFDEATINLSGKKKFTLKTVNNSDSNKYVQRVELNGKPHQKSYFSHQDMINGGTLTIFMGDKPGKEFGIGTESRPQ